MHHLANFTTLNNKSCLHTLSNRYEIMMNGTHSKQRRNGNMLFVNIPITKDDVVVTILDTLLGFLA